MRRDTTMKKSGSLWGRRERQRNENEAKTGSREKEGDARGIENRKGESFYV